MHCHDPIGQTLLKRQRLSTWGSAAALLVVAHLAASVPATATFPGRNGLIAATLGSDHGCRPYRAVHTFRFDGRAVRNLRQVTCESEEAHDAPRWTPDGKRLLYRDIGDPRFPRLPGDLYLVNADGSGAEVVGQSPAQSYAWAPDGRNLAWNGIYIGPTSDPQRRFLAAGRHPAWSPDGRSLVFIEDDPVDDCGDLVIFDIVSGDRMRVLVESEARGNDCLDAVRWPDWSPDGKKITFSGTGSRTNHSSDNFDIYRIGIRGRSRRQLTHNNSDDDQPAWSPDQRWIAFTSARGFTFMRPDGTGKRRSGVDGSSPSWQALPPRERRYGGASRVAQA